MTPETKRALERHILLAGVSEESAELYFSHWPPEQKALRDEANTHSSIPMKKILPITVNGGVPFAGRLTPEEAASQAFEPARKFSEKRGHINVIAEAVSTITGHRVTRQMVGRWLNGTATPSLGMGLALILVCHALETPAKYRNEVQHAICMTLTPTQK